MAGSEGSAGSGSLVLVLNSGSSSVKFALLTPDTGERVLGGLAEEIGTPEAVLRIRRYPGDAVSEPLADGSYNAVISRILDRLADDGAQRPEEQRPGPAALIGVGHRVVHGGDRFSASTLVDDQVIAAIREFAELAPLHNPANLTGLEAVSALRPELPQVAVFDTAFHQSMPGSEELTQVLDTQSGLLGLSGVGNDMRSVEAAAVRGDERAQLTLEIFVHRLAKAIAGLVTCLGRLDALVFTGGIGENSAVVRGRVLRRLGFLGLVEDPEANAGHGRSTDGRISRPGPVQALVVPTDEELMIARDTARLVPGPAIALM